MNIFGNCYETQNINFNNMEDKQLNLVEILKDCPRGTKLYSTIHGEVELNRIVINDDYPIEYFYKDINGATSNSGVMKDGRYSIFGNGECTLFPSKDQRDWSKFKILSELIDGEFYYCVYNYNQTENHVIFIYKKHIMYKTNYYAALDMGHSISSKNSFIINNNKIITELRKATEKEKRILLNTIEIEGYKWDEEKRELIEPRFDISTLETYDKVLMRDNGDWFATMFSHYKNGKFHDCGGCSWLRCVPYNDETKHLRGTTGTPPKKYITWV